MDSPRKNIDEALILAYLNGEEIEPETRNAIEEWLRHGDNLEQAKAMLQAWELSALFSEKPVHTAKALSAIKVRMRGKKAPVRAFANIHPFIKIAASFLLVGVAAVWVFLRKNAPDPIQLEARQDKIIHQLTDSTTVTLRRGSNLEYDLNDFETTSVRKVYLSGEAFFDVIPDKNRPFIVQTRDAEIHVVGTAFLVRSFEDQPTYVAVTEGKVRVHLFDSQKEYMIEAGGEATANANKTMGKLDMNELYWKTGILKFQNDSLSTVIQTLGREFSLNFNIRDSSILSCKFTGTFRKQSVDMIFDVIEETHGLTFRQEGSIVSIEGNGCK